MKWAVASVVAGCVLVSVGVYLVYPPAALILVGSLLATFGLLARVNDETD